MGAEFSDSQVSLSSPAATGDEMRLCRLLLEASGHAILLVQGTNIRYANLAVATMFGAQRVGDLLKQSVTRFIHPGQRQMCKTRWGTTQDMEASPGS